MGRKLGVRFAGVLVILAGVMAGSSAWGQDAAAASKPSPEYTKAYDASVAAMKNKQFDEALAKLDEAEKIQPNLPGTANLRGAIYTEKRDFAKAAEWFEKAHKLEPKAFGPRFNLGEVLFLQKQYPASRARFEALLKDNPKNDLVTYKIYLTYLLEGNAAKAKEMLSKFDFAGETPAYYFANAAMEFSKNNKPEALGWIASAQNIYNVQINDLFADSLVEVGWFKPGEDQGPAELAPPPFAPAVDSVAPSASPDFGEAPSVANPKLPAGAGMPFQPDTPFSDKLPDLPGSDSKK